MVSRWRDPIQRRHRIRGRRRSDAECVYSVVTGLSKGTVMTTAMDGLITIDERGEVRIDGSRIKVKHLVLESRANGWGPRELQEQFPSLSLAQIHAAFAYYHAHQSEMDAQIER